MERKQSKEENLQSAVGTHQLYLHPPFLAVRKKEKQKVDG